MLNRWKQQIRRFTSILLTTSITVTTAGSFPLHTFAASEKGTYVSEVMAYQGSLEDARADYPDYFFVEDDISQGGGSDISTYLGYRTTDDVSLAIRDMATLPMSGNFKMTDYATLVEQKKDDIKGMVYGLQVAAREYKANYEAGKQRALDAYDLLNKYYEEDTKLKMGDFFLAEESEVTYENYETLFMEGNSTTLQALQKILLTASDTEEDTWIDRVAETKDFKGLLEKENANRKQKKEAAISYKAAKTHYDKLYKDRLKNFEAGWDTLREGLEKYMEVGISLKDKESIEYIEDNVEEEDNTAMQTYVAYGGIFEILDKIPYGEGSLVDLFLMPFENVDEEEMYVIMDAMSEAQLELGPDVGLPQLFLCTSKQVIETGDEKSVVEITEETKEIAENDMTEIHETMSQELDDMIEIIEDTEIIGEEITDDHAISVYAGVDRDYFKGTLGITSDGDKQQLSNDTPWYATTTAVISSYVAAAVGVGLVFAGICNIAWGVRQYNSDIGRINDLISYYTKINTSLGNKTEFLTERVEGLKKTVDLYKSTNQEEGLTSYWERQLNEARKEIETLEPKKSALQQKIDGVFEEKEVLEYNKKASRIIGVALIAVGIALTGYSLYVNIQRIMNEEEPEYLEIPEKMVDSSEGKEGMQPYLYYNVVRNQNGKAVDLNSYTSGNWLALYTTRSCDAGLPILAEDFGIIQRGDIGSDTLNKGFAHEFGAKDPENLLGYSKNAQDEEATYLFYNHGEENLAGSVFGGNDKMMLLILACVVIAGGAVILYYRKKERATI